MYLSYSMREYICLKVEKYIYISNDKDVNHNKFINILPIPTFYIDMF